MNRYGKLNSQRESIEQSQKLTSHGTWLISITAMWHWLQNVGNVLVLFNTIRLISRNQSGSGIRSLVWLWYWKQRNRFVEMHVCLNTICFLVICLESIEGVLDCFDFLDFQFALAFDVLILVFHWKFPKHFNSLSVYIVIYIRGLF